jgi:hypothetical protein
VGQSITFDTGRVGGLATVKLAWYQGDTRRARFDILTSSDNITWKTLAAGATSSGTSTALETYPLAAATGRYVRIVNRGNSPNTFISLLEARVNGW